jgi:hypothetical protein
MSSQGSFSEYFVDRTPLSSPPSSLSPPPPSSPPPSLSPPVDPEQLQAKLARPRTCWVFNHMPDEDPETKYFNLANGRMEWRCKYCPKKYLLNGGTRCPKVHLRAIHLIDEKSPRDNKVKKRQLSMEDSITMAKKYPHSRRRLSEEASGLSIDPDVLEKLYINFLASCNQPFRLVECSAFRSLLSFLNEDVEVWLPNSSDLVTTWLMRQRDHERERVQCRLWSAYTRIHLSLDLWTSPNHMAILGVIATFISDDSALESFVLALRQVKGDHSGENIANYVMEVIQEWGIAPKLGYIQMDNASNNDTMMKHVSIGKLLHLIPLSLY